MLTDRSTGLYRSLLCCTAGQLAVVSRARRKALTLNIVTFKNVRVTLEVAEKERGARAGGNSDAMRALSGDARGGRLVAEHVLQPSPRERCDWAIPRNYYACGESSNALPPHAARETHMLVRCITIGGAAGQRLTTASIMSRSIGLVSTSGYISLAWVSHVLVVLEHVFKQREDLRS